MESLTLASQTLSALFSSEYIKYRQEDFHRPKRADITENHPSQPLPKVTNNNFPNETHLSKNQCRKHIFNDTLLIIGLGSDKEYEGIPLYDLLYKGGFEHRIICGPSSLSNDSDIKIEIVNTRNGAFLYDCLSHAVVKYPDYKGYLFVAEEILVNYWNFIAYDKEKIWQDASVIHGPVLYAGTPTDWEWWASPWGMRALEKAFEYLIERNYGDLRKSKLTEGDWKPEWDVNNALNSWLWNGKGEYRAYWINKTILYLPSHHVHTYKKLAKIFRQSGVRHAIAMPTMMRLLELEADSVKLRGELIDAFTNSSVLSDRDSLVKASNENDFLFVNGGRKERRVVLNDLKLKEFAMGKFLYYDECPD